MEKLATRNMVRAPKPKPDPDTAGHYLPNGKAAKAGLNKGIYANCWAVIASRLDQKMSASGTALMYVPAALGSLQWRQCGHIAHENRKIQAEFQCVNCGRPRRHSGSHHHPRPGHRARAHLRTGGNTRTHGCARASEKTRWRASGIRNHATSVA